MTAQSGGNPSGLSPSQWWLLVAVGFSALMVASQTSALNAILPFIARSLQVDLSSIQWVVLAYLFVSSGLLLAFGRLCDIVGHRRMFLCGFIIFITGSVLSSLAQNLSSLIVTRIVQAIGGGMITSASAPLITRRLPGSHRGRGLSAQIVMVYFGLAAGPGLGGILADTLGWRWVFLINVPMGIVSMLITVLAIAKDEPAGSRQKFDLAGAVTFTAALAALFVLLGAKGLKSVSGSNVTLFLGFAILATAFVALELKRPEPLLDLRLFKSRFFSAATASAMINYIGYSSLAFLVPFYLVDGMGYGATHAGILIMAMPITMMLCAPFSGWLSDRIGPRIPASVGMALLSLGIFLFSRLGPAPSVREIIPRLVIAGMGLGLFSSANNSAIMGSVPMQRQGVANGVVSTVRQLGMMLGVTLCTTVFTARFPQYRLISTAHATTAAAADAFLLTAAIIVVGVLTSCVRGTTEAN